MKKYLTVVTLLLSVTVFSQQITWEQWQKEAATTINLRPKYGNVEKTIKQQKVDKDFIKRSLLIDSTLRNVSNSNIRLGFYFLYQNDLKTAMRRFNQAYLLDSTNTDIYWGFGAIYFSLGQYKKAKEQYEEGLNINPNNTHLLTDYGTYFMHQYFALAPINKEKALIELDAAITYMTKSYKLDATDQQTTYKLSILYLNKGDCDSAYTYYNECKSLGGQPITAAYTKELQNKCKQNEN
jgi:tetratricopeptide (TPR) repeat protein